ncbi:MAG: hypothetical protein KF861_01855 [Planctomycetaceae bacterium]|nr:hypothetical protein [Planctomycetaceae bacterium]
MAASAPYLPPDEERPAEAQDAPGSFKAPSLLDDVLRSTIASISTGLNDAEMLPDFEAVYRDHGSSRLSFDAVVNLVQRVIDRQFRHPGVRESLAQLDVARQIAESYWAEPSVRERLEQLWNKLGTRVQ